MANADKREATGNTYIHTKTIRNTHRHTQTCKHRNIKIQIKQIIYIIRCDFVFTINKIYKAYL